MEKHLFLANEEATVSLGQQLAQSALRLAVGATIFLDGTLGAGKTTFCRGVLNALGHSGAVKSPTYTLVEPYELSPLPVFHFDLYRLADPEELEYMGIRDYFSENTLRLVEWPEKGAGILPLPDLSLRFSVSGEGRTVTIEGISERGDKIIMALV